MPEAVVVGAGPGGLAVAAMLQRAGIETLVVDRADAVASAWRGHYERLHLHTVRWLSHLPGYKIPRRYGKWVARDDVVRYLEAYAAHHKLDIALQTEVTRIDRDGDEWVIRSPQGDLHATYVVVANGHNHTPALPAWTGTFRGELLHASDYRNAKPYAGKDVLVVGSGNTGAEIALDLIETGAASVKVAIRTPPHIVFRQQNGIANPVLGVAFRYLPAKLFDPMERRMRALTVGDLTDVGLPAPPDGLFERVIRDDSIPLVDGSRVRADAVIAATGYKRGLDPIVGHLGVLQSDGRPSVQGGETLASAPNLWFSGYTNPVSGMFRELGIDAKKIGRAVVRARRSSLVDTLRVSAPRVIPGRVIPGRNQYADE